MATEVQKKAAEKVFNTVVKHLDNMEFVYEQLEAPGDDYMLRLEIKGEDLPIVIFIVVDADRGIIMVKSPEFATFPPDKLDIAAKAVCAINYVIADGSYALSLEDGSIMWTITSCFRGSLVGEETIAYLMGASLFTLDHYNDRLLMLKMGALDLDTFVGMLCE